MILRACRARHLLVHLLVLTYTFPAGRPTYCLRLVHGHGVLKLGMFASCRWKHVLLTRYTFVNTLRRITPLVFDWKLPLPMPDLARRLPSSHVPGQAQQPAPVLESNVIIRHEEVNEAADRRGKFMARLNRRIIKSRNQL